MRAVSVNEANCRMETIGNFHIWTVFEFEAKKVISGFVENVVGVFVGDQKAKH